MQWTTKLLIRLRIRCWSDCAYAVWSAAWLFAYAVWSAAWLFAYAVCWAALLFTYAINRFSQDVAQRQWGHQLWNDNSFLNTFMVLKVWIMLCFVKRMYELHRIRPLPPRKKKWPFLPSSHNVETKLYQRCYDAESTLFVNISAVGSESDCRSRIREGPILLCGLILKYFSMVILLLLLF